MKDLKHLYYILGIVLNDEKIRQSFVEKGLKHDIVGAKKGANKEWALKGLNEQYIMHRDNFNELMSVISDINLTREDFEKDFLKYVDELR